MDFSRNIGLISEEDQEKLSKAHVAVCGVGGMGGVCAEVLVRMGVGGITLADHDRYEASNANRQIHCNQATLGRFKVEALADEFRQINPSLNLRTFAEPVGFSNAAAILEGARVIINGMDQMLASIGLERTARHLGIPIVDAWITPFASVFTMSPDEPHWEEFLNFPTQGKSESEITEEDCRQAMVQEIQYTLSHHDPYKYVSRKTVEDVVSGKIKRPSLAPVTWLSGVLMANEAFKIITGLRPVGPQGVFYDQYEHRLVPGRPSGKG